MDYFERKLQKPQKEENYIQHQGVDYDGSDSLITEVFDEPIQLRTQKGVEQVKRSMIYIVSKRIDERTFLKIGASKSTSSSTGGRLSDVQTMLIPGLENGGFKLLYIFIYPYETLTGESYSISIEKALHKHLRYDSDYKSTVLQFASGNPSEWFLPEPNGYKSFLKFVLDYIGVQVPTPEASYHFYTEIGGELGLVRRRKSDVVKVSTRENILQFRHDYVQRRAKQLRDDYNSKMNKAQNVGNIAYFKERLLRPSTTPLGNNVTVLDVKYHSGGSTRTKIHGQYYVQIHRKGRTKAKISACFRDDDGGEWTHVANVLAYMNKLGTLEEAGLTTNHQHYARGAIEKAKDLLKKYHSKDNVLFRKAEMGWIIGRNVIDKNGDKFQAVELVMNDNGQRVTAVKFKPDKGDGFKIAQPRVAIQLAVEYHQDEKSVHHAITDDFIDNTITTAYKKGDFIRFESKYFVDVETQQALPEESIAIVLNDAYEKFDKMTSKVGLFYDLLFEHELWYLNSKDVDEKSKLLQPNRKADHRSIVSFLKNVSVYRNRIIDALRKYKVPMKVTRKRAVRSTNVTRKRLKV